MARVAWRSRARIGAAAGVGGAAFALVGLLVLVVPACGDGSGPESGSASASSSDDGAGALLQGSLPGSWRARAGVTVGGEAGPARGTAVGDPAVAVYGDRGRSWDGALLVASAMDDTGAVDLAADEQVTIGGADQAWILHSDDRWSITRLDGDRYVFVEGRSLDRDDVVRAAGAVTGEPVIAEAGLPDGFRELARGNWESVLWPDPVTPAAPPGGSAVVYGDGESAITLVQSTGPASAVPLVRLDHATEDVVARSQPALLARQGDDVLLQWYEPPGLVVTVASSGAIDQEVRRFADDLRATHPDELERLVNGLPLEDLP